MTKEEFTKAFNMGREYSSMPYGFNDMMHLHWNYKNAEEALKQVKNNVGLADVRVSLPSNEEIILKANDLNMGSAVKKGDNQFVWVTT